MSELNREQIIKALECCLLSNEHQQEECDNCPLDECPTTICQNLLAYHSLALIKELTEENERLREDNHILATEFKDNIIADTVRKMQETLEQRIHSKLSYHGWYLKETVIAEVAKEMLEG